jgi:ABC-2 type transport system permease protein
MHEMWIIARHEYIKLAGKRSFLFGTLGVPVLIAAFVGIMILVAASEHSDAPVGVVDHADILAKGVVPSGGTGDFLELYNYPDESAARAALEAEEIQAFYVIHANYQQYRAISLYYLDSSPEGNALRTLEAHIRANLTSDLPEEIANRLTSGHTLTLRSLDGSREVTGSEAFLAFLVPFIAGFMFIMAVMTSAGYLLQVVSDEKENRTVEIMITSISPERLIVGKTIGLMAVALTQIVTWIVTALIGLWVAAQFIEIPQNLSISGSYILIIGIFFLPAYVLIAGVMTAIGGAVTELRHAQQIGGILNLVFMIPFFFIMLIMLQPNNPIVVGLTLFPATAFATIALRWGLSEIPSWQMITSWIILVASAVFSLWASSRIFRAGMLHYGQNLNLRSIIQAIRD